MKLSKVKPGQLLVVVDRQGLVVGAASPVDHKEIVVEIEPLKDQSLHIVNLPEKVCALLSVETLPAILNGACMDSNGELCLREIKLEK